MKNGILPNDGGWLSQTNKLSEAMEFIDIEVVKDTNAEIKKNA